MSIKKERKSSAEPSTDNTMPKNQTTPINTLSLLKYASHTSCFECRRLHEEEEKWMSIVRAMCNRCHYSDYGRNVDDCIHSSCPLWKYRGCEIVECIGTEKGYNRYVLAANLNKTRGDGT